MKNYFLFLIIYLFALPAFSEEIKFNVTALGNNSLGQGSYFFRGEVNISLNDSGRGEWSSLYDSGDKSHFVSITVSKSNDEYEIFGYLTLEGETGNPQSSNYFLTLKDPSEFFKISSIILGNSDNSETWLYVRPPGVRQNPAEIEAQRLSTKQQQVMQSQLK